MDNETKSTTPSPRSARPKFLELLDLSKAGIAFFRRNTLADTISAILSRDAHPLIQFFKYGICGVAAVTTQVLFFNFFSKWFPFEVADVSVRTQNFLTANLLAFPISNAVAFFSNRLFVFTPGRHRPSVEFAIFTGISLVSFLIGVLLSQWLIPKFAIGKGVAEGSFVLTSAVVNFVCRKFLVFAR